MWQTKIGGEFFGGACTGGACTGMSGTRYSLQHKLLMCMLGIVQEINERMREALKPEDLAEFAIEGEDDRFAQAVGKGGPAAGTLVSVKVGAAILLHSGCLVHHSLAEKHWHETPSALHLGLNACICMSWR